jgi:CheY-like chemotaxis protein
MENRKRILVVDDDADICQTLKDLLELNDYEVVTASSGFIALDVARKTHFDAVLMDIIMPRMNGVETLRNFKKLSPETPVIMATAFAVDEMLNEALDAGAVATLKKPFDCDVLYTTIENSMAH